MLILLVEYITNAPDLGKIISLQELTSKPVYKIDLEIKTCEIQKIVLNEFQPYDQIFLGQTLQSLLGRNIRIYWWCWKSIR